MPSESIVENEAQGKPHWDQAELLETKPTVWPGLSDSTTFSFYSKSHVTSLLSEPQKVAQRLSSQNPQTGQTSVQGEGLCTPTSNDRLPLGQAKGTPQGAEAGVPPHPTVQHQ